MIKDLELIIDLLKSIDNNLLYLKRAIVCDHLELNKGATDEVLDRYWTCKTCGAGLIKGENK